MMARPHILFMICDQMQYQRQGTSDPIAYTPNLDQLASEGAFFTHHHCANAQCVPSRASLQTGLYPHEAGVMIIYGFHGHTSCLNGEQQTIGHVLRDAGYTTAYFGKTHFGTPLTQLGYDHGVERGARPPLSVGDQATVDEALAFLAEHDPSHPLFLTVSLHQPHPPFELIEEFASQYPLERLEVPPSYRLDDLSSKPPFQREHASGTHYYPNEEVLRRELREYYTMISNVDRLFGLVREAFEARSMWDNTVVAFTSDHGDMMGAHRMRLKGTLPYNELFLVPLVLRVPGYQLAGRIINDLSVNVSLPGTLIEAAGLPLPAGFKGGSLLSALSREAPPDEEEIFFEHYGAYWGLHPFRAIRVRDVVRGEWKLVKYYGEDHGEVELYDLVADPHEIVNRVGEPALAGVQADLERRVDEWWEHTGGRDFAYYESPVFKLRGTTSLVDET